ncbi:MAG: DUF222 domain-containing protein [Candidatus Dormibacteria bacterium]
MSWRICVRSSTAVELRFSQTAGRFAQSRYWDDEGFISPYQWTRVTCKIGGGSAGQRINVGQQSASMPKSIAALEAGEIGFQHLNLIAGLSRALDESPMRPTFDERPVLAKARDLTVREFARFCALARTVADRDGHELEQKDQTSRQSLFLKQCEDGMWLLKALLNNENGAALNVAIRALSRKTGEGDERPLAQRRAWALAELTAHGLSTMNLPATNYQRPQLQLTASLESLLGALGAPGAQLEEGHPLNIETLRRIACDCSLSRAVLKGDSSVLEIGKWTRTVSAPMRRAVAHRDQKCQWPGCDRTASWTEAHHIVPWHRGGPTTKDNIILMCYRHHYLLHEGKWTMVVKKDREVAVFPPYYRSTTAA